MEEGGFEKKKNHGYCSYQIFTEKKRENSKKKVDGFFFLFLKKP